MPPSLDRQGTCKLIEREAEEEHGAGLMRESKADLQLAEQGKDAKRDLSQHGGKCPPRDGAGRAAPRDA